eukprot:15467621-Alexandrium_andersonii.AAC.2
MPVENSWSRLAYAAIPLRDAAAMQAENIAYHELVRAIHRVLRRQEMEFDGPWIAPLDAHE